MLEMTNNRLYNKYTREFPLYSLLIVYNIPITLTGFQI